MKRILLISTITSPVIFFSCQKELNDNKVTQHCEIVKGVYYDAGGTATDSADFIYDAMGHLLKWKDQNGYYDYLYQGDNISVITFKKNGTSDLQYLDSVQYYQANDPGRISHYDFSQLPASDTIHSDWIFVYLDNQLNELMRVDYYNSAGLQNDTTVINISWNAAGNLDKMTYQKRGSFSIDSVSFEYDTNPNYFAAIHPNFFLYDPAIRLRLGFEVSLAATYSANNLVRFSNPGSSHFVSYTTDLAGRLVAVNNDAVQLVKYSYQCQ